MTEHSLAVLFDAATVATLAGPRVYERGVGYVLDGRVEATTESAGRLATTVRGTMPYIVELWADRGDRPRWSCTCPAAEDGSFCKHCAAVAISLDARDGATVPSLAGLGFERGLASSLPGALEPDEELAGFVTALPQDQLAEIVLQQTVSDWRLKERLLAEAQAARGGALDLGEWRRRIKSAFATYGDFVSYREASGWTECIMEVIDALEDICDAGHHDAVAGLAEYAHRQAEKSVGYVDDSDGGLTDISSRLGAVHHRACAQGRPDPVELAGRLVTLELTSELDGFGRAAASYAEVLGEAGLAAYREILQSHLKRTGTKGSSKAFAVREAMVGWAMGTGDPDALIEVHGPGRLFPSSVLHIARSLVASERFDEAIQWARRGLAENRDAEWQTRELRDFLAEVLRESGEAEAVTDLFWQTFVSHPSLGAYRRLLDEAGMPLGNAAHGSREQSGTPAEVREHAAGLAVAEGRPRSDAADIAGWKQRCEEELRGRLSRLAHQGADNPQGSDAAVPLAARVLVEILVYEGRLEDAWTAASSHGCAEQMWMTLARARENTHPSDAIGVYEPKILSLIEMKKTHLYSPAVDLMDRVRRLADAAGEPDRFTTLLEQVRTEHRAKRNLKALLDAKGW